MDSQTLAGILRASQVLFPDFAFLGPNGVLELGKRHAAVDTIRIEQVPGEFLHLQSLGIETRRGQGVEEVSDLAEVQASGWYKNHRSTFDLRRFLDFENPAGTQVHTTADEPGWVEVKLRRPLNITAIRLRNVGSSTAVRARGIKVLVRSEGEWVVAHDGELRIRQLQRTLRTGQTYRGSAAKDLAHLIPIIVQVVSGSYVDAWKAFEALRLDPETTKQFRSIVDQELLRDRSLEWTVHGPRRCFRYWNEPEKVTYTTLASKIAADLADLTPNVCFGFGAALAVVRDGDFIPHDDDLDLIIGFDPHEASTLPEALRRIEDFLRPRGYTVAGNFAAHRHVSKGGKHVDVFVGLFEGDTISWYPGTRGALNRHMMFPTSEGLLFGIPVPLPRNPLQYLERLYGSGWRIPDPGFTHTWDRTAYADLIAKGRDRPAASHSLGQTEPEALRTPTQP